MKVKKTNKNTVYFGVLAAIFIISVAIFSTLYLKTNNSSVAFAEQEFFANRNFEYFADEEAEYSGVSFEYKITSSDGEFAVCVIDGEWTNYYGYFYFDAQGAKDVYSGVTCERIYDGYIKVTIDFKNVAVFVGNRPQKTMIFFARRDLVTANGVMRKINFLQAADNGESTAYSGKKCIAGRTTEISAPIALKYAKVAFEFAIPDGFIGKQAAVCLLESSLKNYYGYYFLTQEGIIGNSLSGITCKKLDDGYFRVIMKTDKLEVFTNGTNIANKPYDISELFIRGDWSTADVYIRNVEFIRPFSFVMQEGAATRLEKPYGLKYRANISENSYDSSAEYGMIILPYQELQRYSIDSDYHKKLNAHGVSFKDAFLKVKSDENLDRYVESYISGLTDSDINTEYVGIAYKYKDGEYIYASGVKNTIRSVGDVSERAIIDTEHFWYYSLGGQDLIRELVGCKEQTDGFSINGFDSNVNFKKDEIIPSSPKLSLSAAQGEKESGTVVLSATAEVDGKQYIFTPYDLMHEDGVTRFSKDNISAFNGYYTPITSNYRHILYPNSDATDNGEGYYLVNALVPFCAAATANESVFDRANGDNQTIIVDFAVPKGQKAGKYFGEFRIDVPDEGYKTIAVEFTVYNFNLPEQNNAKNIFAIPLTELGELYGINSGYQSELYQELYDFLLDFNVNAGRIPEVPVYGDYGWNNYLYTLIEYNADPRVSAINLYADYDLATYTYTYDKPKYFLGLQVGTEETTETFNNLIVMSEYDRIGSYVNGSGTNVVYTNYGLRTIFKKLAEYSIENNVNLFKKLIVNSPQNDEPSTPQTYVAAMLSYNAVRRSIDYVLNDAGLNWTGYEDIKSSLNDVPFLVTVSPTDEVIEGNKLLDRVKSSAAYIPADEYNDRVNLTIDYKYLKDFISLNAFFDGSSNSTYYLRLSDYLDNKPEHTHIWWYSCCLAVNPYLNYGANSDRVIMRAGRWAQYGMGIEGELYFAVNAWRKIDDNEITTILTEDEVWQGESNQAGLIEDGVLVYPNSERYEDADFRFVATNRLYAIRESIDDYNYLCYAQKLIGRLPSGDKKANAEDMLQMILSSIYTNGKTITSDADTLRQARSDLASLILELI